MAAFNQIVLILHFLALAAGLSVSVSNIVMLGLINQAATAEKPVLARFPPAMSRVGRYAIGLLWATGLTMVYTKWNGFGGMPWQFHVKITAVVILTIVVIYITKLEGMVRRGDMAAAARIQSVAKLGGLCALAAVIFAVLTFD